MSEVKEKFAENSSFWADYQAAARSRGIAANWVKWYEHWCRQFEKFMRGAPLAEATSEQVDAFLGNMEQNPAIQQWQLTQATDALKVLFADHLHLGWTEDGMLSKNRQSNSQAINLNTAVDHATPQRTQRNQSLTFMESLTKQVKGLYLTTVWFYVAFVAFVA